ncbi:MULTISPECIES: type I-D CRISPR-associated protein Cas7/Csc2 [Metallosphaera]|uniref:type I-D CRISPR-associated protein Cas7/Csc2 n=1 Tax=Metallosphaera TaxID=41980 RepID=UPI001F064A34|nr:type I-D CRISPR-associated protein Cas7/Csc2 [Metallosphaera sedula]MCH1770475.1 type I-D CRISPR-associated protein Cas7/Csc2 [Metallosphaera sedula]
MSLNEKIQKILDKKIEEIYPFFADLSDVKKENAVPRGRVINVFATIQAEGELIIRHEGGEDITLATIEDKKYPIILHEKLTSTTRRKMLELLRRDYTHHKKEIDGIRGKEDDWDCSLRPFSPTKKEEERMGGLCGECPNCMEFGFAVREGGSFNLKSRIEGDLYIATQPEQQSVVVRTFNAVDEVTKTTFIQGEGERTGALFRLSLVREGTIFVGKVVMKDVSPAEFLLALYSLASTSRIGAVTSDFGKISVHIPAIIFSSYEISSGYDLHMRAGIRGLNNLEEINRKINSYLEKFKNNHVLVTSEDIAKKVLDELTVNGTISHEVVKEAWTNGINFRRGIEKFLGDKK